MPALGSASKGDPCWWTLSMPTIREPPGDASGFLLGMVPPVAPLPLTPAASCFLHSHAHPLLRLTGCSPGTTRSGGLGDRAALWPTFQTSHGLAAQGPPGWLVSRWSVATLALRGRLGFCQLTASARRGLPMAAASIGGQKHHTGMRLRGLHAA